MQSLETVCLFDLESRFYVCYHIVESIEQHAGIIDAADVLNAAFFPAFEIIFAICSKNFSGVPGAGTEIIQNETDFRIILNFYLLYHQFK